MTAAAQRGMPGLPDLGERDAGERRDRWDGEKAGHGLVDLPRAGILEQEQDRGRAALGPAGRGACRLWA
jgi:hypothetical protein